MRKIIIPLILVLAIVFAVLIICGRDTAVQNSSEQSSAMETAEKADLHELAKEITDTYRDTPEEAASVASRDIELMRNIDSEAAEQWTKVTDYWNYTRSGMAVNIGTLPDNLPEDSSLCIVVLGFELNSDGTMQDELIGRLETALNCARKYPNAYVVCTGGGTASGNPDVTEAGLMGEWLTENGLDEGRLLIEDKSLSTIENAKFSYGLLAEQAPEVTDLAMVSSGYHIAWGSLLFQAELIKMGVDDKMSVVSNAAYDYINDHYANNTYYYESMGIMTIMEQ